MNNTTEPIPIAPEVTRKALVAFSLTAFGRRCPFDFAHGSEESEAHMAMEAAIRVADEVRGSWLFGWLEHSCSCHHRRGAHVHGGGRCTLSDCYCEGFRR